MAPSAGLAVALALIVLASACTPTPYRPLWLEGGYANTRVNEDTFNVIFQVNAHTSRDTAEAYALYRCAELTLESGFDYFVVIGGNSRALYGAPPGTFKPSPDGTAADRSVVMPFRAFKGGRPSPAAYDAREVLAALGSSIVR